MEGCQKNSGLLNLAAKVVTELFWNFESNVGSKIYCLLCNKQESIVLFYFYVYGVSSPYLLGKQIIY